MTALERYNTQDENNATMQEPFETNSGLYVWEQWTCEGTKVTSIRFYCQDVQGGNQPIFRLSDEDYGMMWDNKK